jgi:hypothetical protein
MPSLSQMNVVKAIVVDTSFSAKIVSASIIYLATTDGKELK